MDRLKKLLLVGVVLCVNFNVSAQTLPFRFGIKAGLNLSSATVSDATNTDLKTGYHIGGTVEYLLSEKFLIQSGLFFSTKGAKIYELNGSDQIGGGRPDWTHTFNELYLELPLYGAYKMNLSRNLNIVLGVGPYFGYGIGGETEHKLNSGIWADGSTERKWNTFGDGVFDEGRDWLRGETLKRLDIGIGIGVDLEYRKFILGIGYGHSLKNLAENDYYDDDLKYRNNNIQFSIGYKF